MVQFFIYLRAVLRARMLIATQARFEEGNKTKNGTVKK
jgi:hypothetical protein